MSSSRLPGKVVAEIEGTPLLEVLVRRLRGSDVVSEVVVATSTASADDAVEAAAARAGAICFRGSLDNVAERTLGAAQSAGGEFFFRANADSPLLPVELYRLAAERAAETDADVVSNVAPRTHPPGASVELVRTSSLARVLAELSPDEREHVTLRFYRDGSGHRVVALGAPPPPDAQGLRIVVDTADDLTAVRALAARAPKPLWELTFDDVVDLHRSRDSARKR